MMRAMVWKEYREHRAIWLALALVGGAGLFGLSRLMAPGGVFATHEAAESLQVVAILLAWTYGLVCGSMLLANERECATLSFLDMLPVRRLELWLAKGLIGLVLFLAQVAVLLAFVLGLGITETVGQTVLTLLSMLFFGLLGMSWGLLFSSRGENVLNVIGLAIVGQLLGALVAALVFTPFALAARGLFPNNPLPLFAVVAVAVLMLTAAPVFFSARIFTQPDRLRGRGRVRAPAAGRVTRPVGPSLWMGWRRMLWLSYSQMRRLILGLSLFSLLLGFLLPAAGPAMWPALTLFLGVLCGVSVCTDEQLHGSFRFLGDQRLPLGRVWVVKVGMRFALALFAAFLLMLPSLVLALFHRAEQASSMEGRALFFSDVLHSGLVGPVVPVGVQLSMWLLYGFTMGQLCGLLFRKSLVAAVVSLGGAALLVSFWIPALLGIGLHFWQVAVPPVILLLVSWMLVPAWAADRLLARATFVRLGAGLVAIGLWMTFGLWYRLAEIPDVPDPFDVRAFAASIPPPEENTAGLKIRSAWSTVTTLTNALPARRSIRPLFPVPQPIDADLKFDSQGQQVLRRGWPAGESELGHWLDQIFAPPFRDTWYKPLDEAADLPLGVVEDPRQTGIHIPRDRWTNAPLLNDILAVRGLQMQARGQPRVFVDHLRIGLALARHLQHLAPPHVAHLGRQAEHTWIPALDRWLEKLAGHPELLKEALAILTRHEAESPDPQEAAHAGYYIALKSLEETPELLLAIEIGHLPHEDPKMRQAEIDAAALLWRIPWEQERHERILRVALQTDRRQRRDPVRWGGIALGMVLPSLSGQAQPWTKREVADLHAAQLKVALRLYQAENGRPARTLAVLVPRYLPSVPADPFDAQAFRYRLSNGERLDWPDGLQAGGPGVALPPGGRFPPPGGPPMIDAMQGLFEGRMAGAQEEIPAAPPLPPGRLVRKGQGILWCVGEDGHDDGGRRQAISGFGSGAGEDVIYLVPPPPK
jgi:hypothetical protein